MLGRRMWLLPRACGHRGAFGFRRPFATSESFSGSRWLTSTVSFVVVGVAGTIVVWPIADLFIAPFVVAHGLKAAVDPRRSNTREARDFVVGVLGKFQGETSTVCIASSAHCDTGRVLERIVFPRPVLYLDLRKAASPHNLLMSVVECAYPEERMGLFGTFLMSIGFCWITLFDTLVCSDSSHNRAVNVGVILRQMHRALKMVSTPQERPLIIIDHLDHGFAHAHALQDEKFRAAQFLMIQHLIAWACSLSFDDNLVDLVVCTDAFSPRWPWQSTRDQVLSLKSPRDFDAFARTLHESLCHKVART